jgi:outer membrane beta-barrel protein
MNQARIGLLVIAALLAGPSYAYAQKKPKKPAAAKAAAAQPAAAAAAPAPGSPVELDADNPQAPAGEAPAEGAAAGETPGAAPSEGGLGDICQIDPSACPTLNMEDAAKRPLNEQMYAVQQIYALRARRFEIMPAWNVTLNDQFVDHPGPVLALNYYVTNVLAIGINGGYYFNSDKVFNAQTRRAARVSVPLTEYLWQAAVNFTYVPMYGKFAGFSDFIFHYDVYMVGGVGAIMTRPIPVVDPDNRSFKWGDPKVAFNVGIGLRIFFNRWFAADLEVRDYIFQDKLEATTVAVSAADKANSATWYGENKITNNVQAQLGVSIFLPTSWE